MKLMHLSDLHIGKRVHGFSLLKDQQYILEQILDVVKQEQPDCVLLAGDIYDKPVPSAEAVTVLDDFLTGLYQRQVCVCLVSGNHDSAERLDFGGRIFESRDIHVAGSYDGETHMVELQDQHGAVRIYLLPFVRPSSVRPYESEVSSYQEAVEVAIRRMDVDPSMRNVLVAHQFVVNGEKLPQVCESEELSLGTLDHVDVAAFQDFDYVALGHLHGPQSVGRSTVRYAGSPLKYSFSERDQKKSVTMIELGKKGQVEIRQIPLKPLRDMRQIQGTMDELLQAGLEKLESDPGNTEMVCADMGNGDPRQDYIAAVLTDQGEIYDALGRLRAVYPNLMRLEFLRESREFEQAAMDMERLRSLTAVELFEEFYEKQRQQPLSAEGRQIIETLLEELPHGSKGGEQV